MLAMPAALIIGMTVVSSARAAAWQPQGDAFVLAAGPGEITYRAPGLIDAGLPGGPKLRLAFFFWHDNWVYERLDAGKPDGPPTIDDRGWLCQSGTWAASKGSPPVHYELALEPTPAGVVAHLSLQKSGKLPLVDGVWCVLTYDKDALAGQQAYLRPTVHARLGSAIEGDGDALVIGVTKGQAVSISTQGALHARSSGSSAFEMRVRPGDFPTNEKATAQVRLGFEPMPTHFPGDISPQREPLAIRGVTPDRGTVPLYGRLELKVDLGATWDNPFDPDDVSLDAEVTTASGREYTMPGFFMVAYRREMRGGTELMVPEDNGTWRVRLAATEAGPLRLRLVARDRTGTVTREVGPFVVQPGRAKGFIGRSRVDPHYMQFDDGQGFLPIGHNLPIYHASGQTGEQAIRKMAAAGENYNRWWMSSSGFGIEWEDKLGWYRQGTSARIDAMLDLADHLGFYYMMCMDTHQDFREGGWKRNPYNAANGGPCATVKDWFTSPVAQDFYRKRLRYIIARWAWSPHILAWELGNEFEGWANTDQETKIEWMRRMTATLAKLDPYHHLITTSWWSNTGPEECWRLPGMDIVQTHLYTNNDANVAPQVRACCLKQWKDFAKPHLFGEFGIRSGSGTAQMDPKGWNLHNAFWAAICSGCCGIPMPWWHESYIDPLNLYFHFTAIHNFTRDLPFGTATWDQVKVEPLEYVTPPRPPIVRDVVLTPQSRWGKPTVADFHVASDGSINDPDALQALLQGGGHADLRNPPTFDVTYPRAGKLIIGVGRVSNSGLLRVTIDGKVALEKVFQCGEGHGKSWVHRSQWHLWESVYDEDVAVDVPAGHHRITVANLGKDWIGITRYVFTGCRLVDRPNLLVAALAARGDEGVLGDPRGARPQVAIVWIQNRDSDWYNHARDQVPVVPAARVVLDGFPDGWYEVQWWETWKGQPAHKDRVRARDGRLVLQTGEVRTDLAAKIRPAK